jgi:hypothetical protein
MKIERVWAMPSSETFTIKEAARVLKLGGTAIVCGWNSLGLGACNGMELEEVLMVNHGDQNDTIVTVGRKVALKLDFAGPEKQAHTSA